MIAAFHLPSESFIDGSHLHHSSQIFHSLFSCRKMIPDHDDSVFIQEFFLQQLVFPESAHVTNPLE